MMDQSPHCTWKMPPPPPPKKGGGGSTSVETQFFFEICQIQGIWCAQVVNSLILNIQDIAIFAAKFSNCSKSVLLVKLSKISDIGTGKISSWTGKTGNL